ncbi:MAG: hypothetical protein Ct9H300mP11_22210 [Chloroflexota bacterium]|nr:MAG: hypothetical protein Ct9H300mP11_22210 [Chloroflexota bacterium]
MASTQKPIGLMEEQKFGMLRLVSLRETSPTLQILPDLARKHGYTVEVKEEDVTSVSDCLAPGMNTRACLIRKTGMNFRRKIGRMDSQTDWKW